MSSVYSDKRFLIGISAVLFVSAAFAGFLFCSDSSVAVPHGSTTNPLSEVVITADDIGPYYVVQGATVVLRNVTIDEDPTPEHYSQSSFTDFGTSGMHLGSNTASVVGTYTLKAHWSYIFYESGEIDDEGYADITLVVVQASSFTHTVSYNANGGSGTMGNTVVTDSVNGSSNVALAANGFTRTDYTFAGWKIGNTIYQPGQSVSVGANASVTAIAQWTPVSVSITSSSADADLVVNNTFSREIAVSPAGVNIAFTGPSWLSLSGSTLVGTPTAAGNYTVTVTASNSVSEDSQTFNIHVENRLSFSSVPTGGILASPVN